MSRNTDVENNYNQTARMPSQPYYQGERSALLNSSPYTMAQLFREKFVLINYPLGVIIVSLINLGVNYGVVKGDAVGLFEIPDTDNPEKTSLAYDLLITGFVVTLLNSLLMPFAIRKALRKGDLPLVDFNPSPAKTTSNHTTTLLSQPPQEIDPHHEGCSSCFWSVYFCFPIRINNTFLRSIILAVVNDLLLSSVTILILWIMCKQGSDSSSCQMGRVSFIWFKALWAGFVLAVVYPVILVAAMIKYVPVVANETTTYTRVT